MSKGQKFILEGKDEFRRTSYLPNGDQTGNAIDDECEAEFTVVSVNGAGYVLEMEFKRMFRLSINPGGRFRHDHPNLIGSKIRMRLSKDGVLSGFEELDDLPEMTSIIRRTAAAEYIHRAATIFPKLPEKPVGIGGTWTYTLNAARPYIFLDVDEEIKTVYTYTVVEETKMNGLNCLKIEMTYKQEARVEGERRGQPFSENIEGRGKEILYFAFEQGMFISRKGTFEMTAEAGRAIREDEVSYEITAKIKY